MEMKYCMQCGGLLRMKEHETEGHPVPWCDSCRDYRFPVFNTAVSMEVFSPDGSRILLVRQYGRPFYILPAGYINRGEAAEEAIRREMQEELGLTVRAIRFNRSRYFPPSNTLLLNFAVTATGTDPSPNWEIDEWRWFTPEEARGSVKPESYAKAFLLHYLDEKGGTAP